jgi:hypothetical protein
MGNPDSMICEGRTVPRRPRGVKCSAATLADELTRTPQQPAFRSFHRRAGTVNYRQPIGVTGMRIIAAAGLLALGMMASQSARADILPVPPFKGNDTGGIIAYSMATQVDARQVAVDHCARYGKVAKFLAVQAYEGGYISFSCRWVPYGAAEQPIRTLY